MTSTRCWHLLTSLLMMNQVADCCISVLVTDFLSVFNGDWSNRIAVEGGSTSSLMEARFVPVDIPALRPKTMMYFENSLNGSVFSLYLCEVVEVENNTVHLIPYHFTGDRKYKAGEFDLNLLSNVTESDLISLKQCVAKFQTPSYGVFSGPCPQCNHTRGQAHPECELTLTCDKYTIIRPISASEYSRPPRDEFRLIRPR
ncbi:hypothetical protein BsWGS_23111 [Bradybaena similaris]